MSLVAANTAWAQTSTAEVSGTLKDDAGSPVAQTAVSARNVKTNFIQVATSDGSGRYWFSHLPPGHYDFTVEAAGFAPFVRSGIELTIGAKAQIDVVLTLHGSETVAVTAESPILELTKTATSQVIEGRQITDLPIDGRQFIDFAVLTPSVRVGQAITSGGTGPLQENVTKIAFAGLSEQHSNFFAIDGADHTISLSGFQHLTPSQEAVQEFRIITSSYSAEYGRALGGVVSILTRSGTNDLSGSAYYFGRDDALDSKSILAAPGFEVLEQHQFGATLGGPLKKDRTFFFASYEGQRKKQSPNYSSFLLNNLDAINAVKGFYGLPPERLDVLRKEDSDQFLVRLDHRLGSSHYATIRYHLIDQGNDNSPAAPGNSGGPSTFRRNPIRDQSAVVKLLSTPAQGFANDALFQFSHRDFRFESPTGQPNLQISNLLDLGRAVGPADAYQETRFQLADTVSVQKGRHSLKFGIDVSYVRDSVVWPIAVNGFGIFSPDSFFGAPPFGSPTPFLFLFSVPRELRGQPIPPRSTDFANVLYPGDDFERAATFEYEHSFLDVFIQDEFRPTGGLTLNYGLRYAIETRGDFDLDEDLNNLQPRLGFAQRLGRRGVVRGGFGVFYGPLSWANSPAGDRSYVGGGTDLARLLGSQAAAEFSGQDPLGVTLSPIPDPRITGPAAFDFITRGIYPRGPLLTHVFNQASRDLPSPRALQWSVDTEFELARDLSVGLGYLGVSTRGLVTTLQVNSRIVGEREDGKRLFAPLSPQFGIYQNQVPLNSSIYHGATFRLVKRFSHGFGANANYTFSRAIDLVNSGSSQSFKDVAEDGTQIEKSRGVSNQHVAHRFVVSVVAEGPAHTLLTGFRLGAIVTLESPRFYTIFAGFDANGDLESGSDRVGTIGKNTYRGDSFRNVDLRLSRAIGLGRGIRAELVVDVFNVFNRANVTDISTVYGAPVFVGPVPARFGDGVPAPVPSFGTPAQVADPRQVQLGLKLTF